MGIGRAAARGHDAAHDRRGRGVRRVGDGAAAGYGDPARGHARSDRRSCGWHRRRPAGQRRTRPSRSSPSPRRPVSTTASPSPSSCLRCSFPAAPARTGFPSGCSPTSSTPSWRASGSGLPVAHDRRRAPSAAGPGVSCARSSTAGSRSPPSSSSTRSPSRSTTTSWPLSPPASPSGAMSATTKYLGRPSWLGGRREVRRGTAVVFARQHGHALRAQPGPGRRRLAAAPAPGRGGRRRVRDRSRAGPLGHVTLSIR